MINSLQNMSLDRIYSVIDLGVLLDPKLKFDSHISSTVNKAMSVLGFIKRWYKEFDDPYTTKLLFTPFVRPNLEYCSSVWSPQYQVHIDRIECVQKQFLLFALRGLNWEQNVRFPSYSSRLLLISTFNVPVRLMRNYHPINLPRCSSNFSQHEPFRVLSNNYNNLYH